jgi:soluble lytic murein transglycosylase-like protein
MKWMNQATEEKAIRVVSVSMLLLMGGVEVCGQKIDVEEAAVRRARRYEPNIARAASKHGVDARLLWVIAYLETRFNPTLVSRKGARGMMQFMPDTARRFGLADPHDPIAAIDAAARYVRHLGKRFNRSDLILAAYNAGETAVEAYLTGRPIKAGDQVINPKGVNTKGIPPYPETRVYVATGLRLIEQLRQPEITAAARPPVSNGGSMQDEVEVRSSGVARKSIRADIRSEERQSSRRSIYFVGVKEDH